MKKFILRLTVLVLFVVGTASMIGCGNKKENNETHQHQDGEKHGDNGHQKGEENHEGHDH